MAKLTKEIKKAIKRLEKRIATPPKSKVYHTFKHGKSQIAYNKIVSVNKVKRARRLSSGFKWETTPKWEYWIDLTGDWIIIGGFWSEKYADIDRNRFISEWEKVLEVKSGKVEKN